MKKTLLLLACLCALAACTSNQPTEAVKQRRAKYQIYQDSIADAIDLDNALADTFGCGNADIHITKTLLTTDGKNKQVRIFYNNISDNAIRSVEFGFYIVDSLNKAIIHTGHISRPPAIDTGYTIEWLSPQRDEKRIGVGTDHIHLQPFAKNRSCVWTVSAQANKVIRVWPYVIMYNNGEFWSAKHKKS